MIETILSYGYHPSLAVLGLLMHLCKRWMTFRSEVNPRARIADYIEEKRPHVVMAILGTPLLYVVFHEAGQLNAVGAIAAGLFSSSAADYLDARRPKP